MKIFENSRLSASNFKSFSRSLEQFFLTVAQNNFGNKIPILLIILYCKQHRNKVYLAKANIIWHFDFTSRNKSGNRVFLYCSPPPHKELISPKRFTNLPLESMISILNWIGLIHTYRSRGVPQTPKSNNALIFRSIQIHMRSGNPYQIWPLSITITWRLRFVNLFVEGSRGCATMHLRDLSKIDLHSSTT